MRKRTRITHIITGLNVGGAENSLCKLLEIMDKGKFENVVISLLPEGPLATRARAAGAEVYLIDMKKGPTAITAFYRLYVLLKELKPDIVQTWMYHPNLLGGVVCKFLGTPVVWGIHHSNLNPKLNKRTTLWVVNFCAWLSGSIPTKIACCAQKALDVHAAAGYDRDRMLVIPNGFDTDTFKPDTEARCLVRAELGVSNEALLIGMVGRFDPQKDHENFFGAARILADKIGPKVDVVFVLCGDGIDWKNDALTAMIPEAVKDRTRLMWRRTDMPQVYAGLDVFVLSSAGEAFPNVVGEAMSCEVPCVVTDVGDAALIIGDTGFVVPPGNSDALASGIQKMLEMGPAERSILGKAARQRIQDCYSIDKTTRMYEDLYESLLSGSSKS